MNEIISLLLINNSVSILTYFLEVSTERVYFATVDIYK